MKSGAGVSRYLRLYRVLSQALAEGRFGAGEPMPSEPQLMKDYGVSRSTVRRALAQLEAEERIDRRRGSGTFAREQKDEAAASRNFSPMLDGAGRQTAAATSRTIASRTVPTPAFLPDGQAEFGTSVHLVRRIRYVEREPVALESAYLPREVGSGLTRQRLGTGGNGILTLLASLGHHSASLEREFVALEADPLAADSLELAVGAPVFSVRTLARDRQHHLLACVDCVYRPDRYEANVAVEIGDPKRRRRTDGDD
ncbi:MAG TPA: GntR family transcriptional regulator [Steroidobacteraceae bacterium]|nr:GntR family transcriptional regulator [Steroidobacteraceae bacterium]